MKAISIRQPWAWMILNAGKDIENRNWRTSVRGTVLIHAATKINHLDYQKAMGFWENLGIQTGPEVPPFMAYDRGGIVGQVDIVDCVDMSDSPWFVGPFGFVLKNPKILPFRPCKGALSFFEPKG